MFQEMLDLLLEMLAEKNLNFEQPHYEAWNIAIGILLTSIGEIMEGIEMEYITWSTGLRHMYTIYLVAFLHVHVFGNKALLNIEH